jgi:hypothetical protein
MTLQEIFTTYWSQVTLLIIGFSYFIKRIFDNKAKKAEINHTVFQQKRLEAIEYFMQCYSETKIMWFMLSIYDVMERRTTSKELDAIIFPSLNKLKRSVIIVSMYIEDSKPFHDIEENMITINSVLTSGYFEHSTSTSDRVYAFQNQCHLVDEKNEKLLLEINKIIRNNFS